MTIYEFKKGDEVVRTKPSKPYSSGVCDRSYMGRKLIYMGIANGLIYLKKTDPFDIKLLGEGLIDLNIDMWDEGWDYYVDPNTLFGDDFISLDSNTLKERLSTAIKDEDYKLASKLKEIIENNKNR